MLGSSDIKNHPDNGIFGSSAIKNHPDNGMFGSSDIKNHPDNGMFRSRDIKNHPDNGMFGSSDIKNHPDNGMFGSSDIKNHPDNGMFRSRDIKNHPDNGMFGSSDIKNHPDNGMFGSSDITNHTDNDMFGSSDIKNHPDNDMLESSDIKNHPDNGMFRSRDIKNHPDNGMFGSSDIKNHPDNGMFGSSDIKNHPDNGMFGSSDIKNHPDNGMFRSRDIKNHPDNGMFGSSDIKNHPDNDMLGSSDIKNHPDNGMFGSSDIKNHTDNGMFGSSDIKNHPDNGMFGSSDIKNHPDNGMFGSSDIKNHPDNGMFWSSDIKNHPDNEVTHRFSQCAGKNVLIKNNGCMATRVRNFNHGLVFSSDPLKKDEIFEVRVEQLSHQWSGSLRIGLTSMAISDTTPVSLIPLSSIDLTLKTTWIVTGSEVKRSGVVIKENYAASLERLEAGTRVGVQRSHDGTMHIYINGEDMGIAASNIPKNVFAVIDLFGMVDSVSVVSNAVMGTESTVSTPTDDSELTCHVEVDSDQDKDTSAAPCLQFNSNHGKNIMLCNGRLTAERAASYNQGVVVSCQKLTKNRLFQIRLDQLNPRWSSSLMVGVLSFPPDRFNFPVSALAIKKSCIVVQGDAVYVCGAKIKEHYGPNLDKLHRGHMVGVLVDEENAMHLYVNGVDQGVAMREVSQPCYAIIDLYGQCEKVTIMPEEINAVLQPAPVVMEDREKADLDDVVKEKQQQQQSRSTDVNIAVRNCEYLNICNRIKSQLALPDGYFDPQLNMCFCETCHKIRGDETYIRKGDPPREFAVPFGWCKFMLRLSNKAHLLNVAEKWHVAYYGCHMEALRRILDSCDLHSPGETVNGGSLLLPQPPLFTEKTQPDGCAVNPISLSPTLRYAGCNEFAPKNKVIDPKTKKTYYARVAIQAWVKPGSYKIGPQSIQANEPIDPRFSNNELEWSTKEHGSTMIQALLIKIE
ncbi:hypothetical protein CHS0354_030324 [Potamilus streckersoni]|uniref:NHR domain-containing protein n=1 Tax=Potamilus streckersoni TaxID=2493646 RepID=A0AAE0T4T2_9BIVA|nr:hypothetical protein CHS0354_030324 [Potamilus streckersoni]